MSCHDAVQFLTPAIESILAQEFSDFEFILIDDGSTDDTLAMIKDYAANDKRIVVIEKENTGLTDSLNAGLIIAKGEWIARLDSDDIALPNRLAVQISSVYNNPNLVVLGTGCFEINENGIKTQKYLFSTHHHKLVKSIRSLGSVFPHSSAMFRRDPAVKLGGYNKRMLYSQDCDMWLRLSEIGQLSCCKSPLVLIRKHAAQISHIGLGNTQPTFGIAAIVCYELRSLKFDEPSRSDDQEWNVFINWIRVRLEQIGLFDINRFRKQLRGVYTKEGQSLLFKNLDFIKLVLAHPQCCLRISLRKYFGSWLPLKLAYEWIQLTGTPKQNTKNDGS
jgi:glycosyltransferase involved in cell wall biosynthesis